MKKNLFEIDTEEVQRILSLHEERSQNQYLNIISEQDNQKYSIQSKDYILSNVNVGSNRLKLFKGTTFTKRDNTVIAKTNYQFVDWTGTVMLEPEILVNIDGGAAAADSNQVKKGTVTYYCSGPSAGKFNTDSFPTSLFYDDKKVLSIQLNQLCGGRIGKYTQQKSGNFTANNEKPLNVKFGANTITVNKGMDINYVNNKATVINNYNNYYINFTCPNNFTVEPTYDRTQAIKGMALDSYTLTFFQNKFCTGKPKEVKQVKQTEVQPKSNFTALYTIQNQHDLGSVKVNVGDTIIKSTKYPDYAAIMRVNTPIAYYNCKTNAWNDIQISDTKGALTGTIKEKVCPQVLLPTPVVDPNNPNAQQTVTPNAQQTVTPNAQQTVTPNAQQTVTPNAQQAVTPKTQQVNRQQQFAQRTVTAINNVQKTLGVPQTGQLKNSDIEDLLNKLK
jgi:hypothetical protein